LKSDKNPTPITIFWEQDFQLLMWPLRMAIKTLQFLLYTQQVCGALRWLRTQLKTESFMWRPHCESC